MMAIRAWATSLRRTAAFALRAVSGSPWTSATFKLMLSACLMIPVR